MRGVFPDHLLQFLVAPARETHHLLLPRRGRVHRDRRPDPRPPAHLPHPLLRGVALPDHPVPDPFPPLRNDPVPRRIRKRADDERHGSDERAVRVRGEFPVPEMPRAPLPPIPGKASRRLIRAIFRCFPSTAQTSSIASSNKADRTGSGSASARRRIARYAFSLIALFLSRSSPGGDGTGLPTRKEIPPRRAAPRPETAPRPEAGPCPFRW